MAKGRRNNKRKFVDEKGVSYSKLDVGQVQATAAVEYAYINTETPTQEGDLQIPVLAIEHCTVALSELFDSSLSNHESDYTEIIKKKAAIYYSSLAPTTLQDILDNVNFVVDGSNVVFAAICSAWKHQNCVLFEDEDHNALGPILSTLAATNDAVKVFDTARINAGRVFNFGISNNDWKKRVLSALNKIYLNKSMSDLIYTMFGHFIQVDLKEDGITRLMCYDPKEMSISDAQSLDDFADFIDSNVGDIIAAYNKYPFMDEILKDLRMTHPGETYDFTRDLAAMRLNILGDTDQAFQDLTYMLGTAFSSYPVDIDPSKYILTRLVSLTNQPAAHIEFYKNEHSHGKTLAYTDRTIIDINSATNAFRGCFSSVNISFMYVKFSNNVRSVGYGVIAPISGRWNPSANMGTVTAAQYNIGMMAWCEVNTWIDVLDMPTDAALLIPLTGEFNTANQAFKVTTYKLEPRLSASDYLISAGDVDSVISDAAYCLLTGSLLVETPSTAQTLGNNGTNSTK